MPAAKPETDEPTVFDAVLTPHRSLGPAGFRILIVAVIAMTAIACLRFMALGAWPIAAFFVIDAALIYLFFKLNYRDGRASERLRLTPYELRFARVDPRGRRTEWRFNPLFVRLAREDHAEFGTTRLALRHRAEEIEIARFLNGAERGEFADALGSALRVAREGPRFDHR